ncbi:MAG: trans-sulfuration enzyme family protein, partial [bacterium]
PVHLTSTYELLDLEPTGLFYQRYDNQTRQALETKLAYLEKAKYCLVFSSGMAAITSTLFSLLKPNSKVLAFDDLYSVTKKIFNNYFPSYNIKVDYIDFTKTNEITKNYDLIWLESPTNPLMKTINTQNLVQKIKNSNPKTIVVFDNTFLSPYFYNPLLDGVDIVVHSLTKYINGHSDSIGGAIMTNNESFYQKIKEYRNTFGNPLSPFDSYLTLRGLKTLHLRMEKHQENCQLIIEYLKTKDFVEKIFYPSFADEISPNVKGFGGTFSFLLSFTQEQIKTFIKNLKLISYAVSLGGVESLICFPYYSTHKGIENIPPNLIRLSVGIENAEDIIQDLENAFLVATKEKTKA